MNESKIRTFETGATRDTDKDKFDYEGFLSPLVLERYAQYMHQHRKQSDGEMRASDNWQKGIPIAQYMKSKWRHLIATWKAYRTGDGYQEIEDSLCAELFNTSGMLHEILKERENKPELWVCKKHNTRSAEPGDQCVFCEKKAEQAKQDWFCMRHGIGGADGTHCQSCVDEKEQSENSQG